MKHIGLWDYSDNVVLWLENGQTTKLFYVRFFLASRDFLSNDSEVHTYHYFKISYNNKKKKNTLILRRITNTFKNSFSS